MKKVARQTEMGQGLTTIDKQIMTSKPYFSQNKAQPLIQNNATFLQTILNHDGRICDPDGDWLTICLILGPNSLRHFQFSWEVIHYISPYRSIHEHVRYNIVYIHCIGHHYDAIR